MKRAIANQFKKPNGFGGIIIGVLMKKINKALYTKLINRFEINNTDKILEIGFGAGDTINLLGHQNKQCKLYGIDFSELMHKKTRKTNTYLIENKRLELFFGNFLNFDFKSLKFNIIYCINVVYFWDDLKSPFQKVYELLEPGGLFGFYMTAAEDMQKLGVTKTEIFNKHSIDSVQTHLKEAGFSKIKIYEDNERHMNSYYIYAWK